MRVAVLDVGSNTIRLLVVSVDGGGIEPIAKEKVRLPLGEEIERLGGVSETSVAAAAKAVRKLCALARDRRIASLDVFVTAPGRQSANADELLAALTRAAGTSVRVLSTEEEGRLAYGGAVSTAPAALPERIGVCDVGGASTEISVGAPGADPDWVRSVDLGSVRLTARVPAGDRSRAERIADACAEAEAAFAGVEPPPVRGALAVGGSARAARRLVGPVLGSEELAEALRLVAAKPPRAISRRYGVDRARARILPAGLVLLAEVQRRLGVPLRVCDGGIREGAVLATAAELAA